MIEVGQKVLCVHQAIKLFSKTPKYNDVLKVTDISSCGTFIKVEGYKDWYKAGDFAVIREVPSSVDDIKIELDAAFRGWEHLYQRRGVKATMSAFGLFKAYIDSISEEVKALREEVKELKEKING